MSPGHFQPTGAFAPLLLTPCDAASDKQRWEYDPTSREIHFSRQRSMAPTPNPLWMLWPPAFGSLWKTAMRRSVMRS